MSATKFNGNPVRLDGSFISVGSTAPKVKLVKKDLTDFSLHELKGKRIIMNIFPSVDTEVCAASVRRFNQMAASMPQTAVLCISRDLPFAQSRFCAAEGIDNVTVLSDFRTDSTFGTDYGTLIADGPMAGLLARAIVVIDPDGKISYTQLVPEITSEPDYSAVLAHLQSIPPKIAR